MSNHNTMHNVGKRLLYIMWIASVQSDLDILCSSTYTAIAIDSVNRQQSCMNEQDSQGLHCLQIA